MDVFEQVKAMESDFLAAAADEMPSTLAQQELKKRMELRHRHSRWQWFWDWFESW